MSVVDAARPTVAEMAARRDLVGTMLATAGFEVAVVYGDLASPHDIWYLTGWRPGWDTYLVFSTTELPRLYVPSPNHVPSAVADAGSFAEVAWVGPDPMATVAAAVRSLGGRGPGRDGRVALIGPIPHRAFEGLSAALDGQRLADVTGSMAGLRLVKSVAEIDRARIAAGLVDEAFATLVREARPGLRDLELGAIVEHAYRRIGGDHGICFLASAPMSGGGRTVPAVTWSSRGVGPEDMILVELSVYVWGASSQALRTIALGEPPPEVRRLHDIADRTFDALEAAVRPGLRAADLLAIAGMIDAAGATVVDDVVHGYGGGYLPPVLRTPATQRRPVPDLELREGMLLVLQPNIVAGEDSIGIQTGELVAVGSTGASRLHALPRGLLTVP